MKRITALLPGPVKRQLKNARKFASSKVWAAKNAAGKHQSLHKDDLVDALISLGVEEETDLILHSGLSKLGHVVGGPQTLLDALAQVLGPKATIIVPTYPFSSSALEYATSSQPFDAVLDGSHMGAITELVRSQPVAMRSKHPTHSVAAIGPNADFYTVDHHHSVTPCGPGSPFRRLSERQGQILSLGAGIGKISSYHVVEDAVEDFPFEVYYPKTFTKRVKFEDKTTQSIQFRVHNPDLANIRVDNDKEAEIEVEEWLRKLHLLKSYRIGQCTAFLMRAHGLDDALKRRLAKEGTTIYRKRSLPEVLSRRASR